MLSCESPLTVIGVGGAGGAGGRGGGGGGGGGDVAAPATDGGLVVDVSV